MGTFRLLAFAVYGIGVLSLMVALAAHGRAVATAATQDIVVTLTDEPCAVAEVANLPHRATWLEKGKTFEGCWGSSGPVIVSYWREDRSVAIMPARVFQAAKEI